MIKPIKIKFQPPFGRGADMHLLATRVNEVIEAVNRIEADLQRIREHLGIVQQ